MESTQMINKYARKAVALRGHVGAAPANVSQCDMFSMRSHSRMRRRAAMAAVAMIVAAMASGNSSAATNTPSAAASGPITTPAAAALAASSAAAVTQPATAGSAAGASVLLRQMLNVDDQLALKKLRDQLNGDAGGGGGGGGGGGSGGGAAAAASATSQPDAARAAAAAAAAERRSHMHPPFLSAVYGAEFGGVNHYRAVINWDDVETTISVGVRLRGYTVTSITPRGATLSAGKKKHLFAPFQQITADDVPAELNAPVARVVTPSSGMAYGTASSDNSAVRTALTPIVNTSLMHPVGGM
ncbi:MULTISPECIES: hypothetical protein [unclassified Burkholderia]|uniref:hypothetical protein n=1 Tax=unclassified Burkholderia TaxID=2613784 RepID=UPI002AB15711|nr:MULTISPECIES: hypothetical protein [unclassified Burkholderia]